MHLHTGYTPCLGPTNLFSSNGVTKRYQKLYQAQRKDEPTLLAEARFLFVSSELGTPVTGALLSLGVTRVFPCPNQVFETAGADIVDGIVRGYNGTILCSGQRGAGKTYTTAGVIKRSMTRLFESLEKVPGGRCNAHVSVSYLQIYCEMLQVCFIMRTV